MKNYTEPIDPKDMYSRYGKQPKNKEAVDKTIKEVETVKEQIDEIYDEEYDEEEYYKYTSVAYSDINTNPFRIYIPVYEADELDNNVSSPQYKFIREVPTIKVRYHKEICPELIEMEKIDKGDFIDLRSAENISLKQGEFKLINLGISVQLPKGYHAEVVPRSSTYKNFGIIMSNSIGIIDESYCGDNDIWHFPAIAMRDTEIHINDRICQFRIVKNRDINIEVVDELGNEDRGGIGSTGKN